MPTTMLPMGMRERPLNGAVPVRKTIKSTGIAPDAIASADHHHTLRVPTRPVVVKTAMVNIASTNSAELHSCWMASTMMLETAVN